MKICKRCKTEKPLTEFYKRKASIDGLTSPCKICIKEYESRPEIRIKRIARKKQWNIDNKEHAREYFKKFSTRRRELRMERYRNDKEYRILVLLRGRMYGALSGVCRSKKTMELIGCSISEFIEYIESQFKKGMDWNNQGEWEIDHIKPCSSFNLIDSIQQRECFNYKNLQPLWAEENRKKGALLEQWQE